MGNREVVVLVQREDFWYRIKHGRNSPWTLRKTVAWNWRSGNSYRHHCSRNPFFEGMGMRVPSSLVWRFLKASEARKCVSRLDSLKGVPRGHCMNLWRWSLSCRIFKVLKTLEMVIICQGKLEAVNGVGFKRGYLHLRHQRLVSAAVPGQWSPYDATIPCPSTLTPYCMQSSRIWRLPCWSCFGPVCPQHIYSVTSCICIWLSS